MNSKNAIDSKIKKRSQNRNKELTTDIAKAIQHEWISKDKDHKLLIFC